MQVEGWAKDIQVRTRGLVVAGLTATLVFAAGFGAWAGYAPLGGAIIARGFIAAAGQNQLIQHLEGGLIKSIHVHEGDRVKAGQILFELDPTAVLAQRDALGKQLVYLSARALRLKAERDGAVRLTLPDSLRDEAGRWGVEEFLAEQEKEFAARLEGHLQEQKILNQRILALNDQIQGLQAQGQAIARQLEIVKEEALRKKDLLDKGLTDRSEYTELLRSEAGLIGQVGQVQSIILSSRTQIVETESQLSRLRTQRIETAAGELNEVRSKISDGTEQMRAAVAVLARIVVVAPSDGIVVRTSVNVAGMVVKPGEVLLELLPIRQDLVVEARISPTEVDAISRGQHAILRFSALNARITPTASASVSYISADRLLDTATQQSFYLVRLTLDGALPPELPKDRIAPGLPVEAYIATGDRTFFEYLVKPITDGFNRALREE